MRKFLPKIYLISYNNIKICVSLRECVHVSVSESVWGYCVRFRREYLLFIFFHFRRLGTLINRYDDIIVSILFQPLDPHSCLSLALMCIACFTKQNHMKRRNVIFSRVNFDF